MPRAAKRVLIYRLGSLGDTLVALPSLHLVARAFPNAERQMLTNIPVSEKAPAAAAILDGSELVHGYIPYPVATRNPLTLLGLLVKLRLWRPDVVVYLAGARGLEVARRDQTFFRLTGAREIIGVPLTEYMQQQRLLADGRTYEPESSRLARNLSPLGVARLDDPRSWDLRFTDAELARAADVLARALAPAGPDSMPRKVLAVSLGTKRQCGDWEQANWVALVTGMAARWPDYALAILGAPSERDPQPGACRGLAPRRSSACPQPLRPAHTARERRSPRARTGLYRPRQRPHAPRRCRQDAHGRHLLRSAETRRLVPVRPAPPGPLSPGQLLGMQPRNLPRRAKTLHSLDHCR